MTFEKAVRILPSFVSHLAKGQTELTGLRSRVQGQIKVLTIELLEKVGETHSGSFRTAEAKEVDRKIEQLQRFLEATE